MKTVLIALVLMVANFARAEDWRTCYSEDGNVEMNLGRLLVNGTEIRQGSFMVNSKRTIGSSYTTCTLAGSNKEVVSNANETTTEEFYYSYGDGKTYKVSLTCDTGYSEVPENDYCLGDGNGD